jgi:hypothetical protein
VRDTVPTSREGKLWHRARAPSQRGHVVSIARRSCGALYNQVKTSSWNRRTGAYWQRVGFLEAVHPPHLRPMKSLACGLRGRFGQSGLAWAGRGGAFLHAPDELVSPGAVTTMQMTRVPANNARHESGQAGASHITITTTTLPSPASITISRRHDFCTWDHSRLRLSGTALCHCHHCLEGVSRKHNNYISPSGLVECPSRRHRRPLVITPETLPAWLTRLPPLSWTSTSCARASSTIRAVPQLTVILQRNGLFQARICRKRFAVLRLPDSHRDQGTITW